MNKILSTLLLIIYSAILSGQDNDLVVISRPVTQGYDYIHNADIQATEYMFPERIDGYEIDENDEIAVVQLRGVSKNGKKLNNSGNIVFYDLKTQMPRWNRKINYLEENASLTGGKPFILKPYSVSALDEATGTAIWSGRTQIYYADKKTATGVGYNCKSMNPNSDNLEGIDLKSGNTIWKRNLDRTYGWNDITKLSDSIILITSDGLTAVNLKTGQGWEYKTPTGRKQTGEAVAKSIGSIVLGVLTGVTVVPNVDVITGLVSNTLTDSTGIYLASAAKISRLNIRGELIWSVDLPKDKASSSVISRKNGFVYLMNKGYAYENGQMRNYGHPFAAIYNVSDGTQHFFKSFDDKKRILNDMEVQGDTISLLFSDKIAQYSISGDSLIAEKTFDSSATGYLYSFANTKTYYQYNDVFAAARENYSKNLIETSTGNVLIVNDKMETEQTLTPGEFFRELYQLKPWKLMYRDGSVVVIDADGKRLANMKATSKFQLKGRKLYEVNDKVLREIDLSPVFRAE